MAGELGAALRSNTKKKMPRAELEAHIKDLMGRVRMGVLCTNNGQESRGTPLEYFVDGMTIYISPDPGIKLRNLGIKPHACLCVTNALNPKWETDWDKVWGLQISGTATVYQSGCPEWEHGREVIKVDSWMRALGQDTNKIPPSVRVIRMPISRVELTEWALLKQGYSYRQLWTPGSDPQSDARGATPARA